MKRLEWVGETSLSDMRPEVGNEKVRSSLYAVVDDPTDVQVASKRPYSIQLCRCALAGTRVEMAQNSKGVYECLRCGASEEGVREAQRLRQLDWQKGGNGQLTPRRIKELLRG